MQLTSLFVVSTTLLAAQVPAQFIRATSPSLPTWSGQASHAVASSMATPSSSSVAAASQPSHYMASHSFQPMVHQPMRPVAKSSSSHSMVPAATPSSSSNFFNTPEQYQGYRQPYIQNADQVYSVPDGGLAPVDPLQPGSDVAPVLIQKPSGIDEGNSFCIGQCYAKKEETHCSKSYVSFRLHEG
ncbi:hypothetical protein F1880_001470 [Penicillium rolfsii]|nr:hypothetical protein F1880_001470 [Penicillium rolfsii]